MGLTLADVADQCDIETWPDTEPAIHLFIALQTQWRTGPSGAIGLDYAVIPVVLRLHSIPRALWRDAFDDLRVLEDEMLTAIAEERKA